MGARDWDVGPMTPCVTWWAERDAVEKDIGTLYVTNLPWTATEDEVQALFAKHVPVVDVRVIQDTTTGRSRGFGFVEIQGAELMGKAISCLNGCHFKGRQIVVTPARQKRSQ